MDRRHLSAIGEGSIKVHEIGDSGSAKAAPLYASLLPWNCDDPDTNATISEAMQDRLADLWADILVADYRARHATPDAQRRQP